MAGVSGSTSTDSEEEEEEEGKGEGRDLQGKTGKTKTHHQQRVKKGSTTINNFLNCHGVTSIGDVSANTVNIASPKQVQMQRGLQEGLGDKKRVPGWTEELHERTLTRLRDWTSGMVKTSALDKVMGKLNKGIDWITIRGSPGEGKTTVGLMALGKLHKQGRDVFLLKSPSQFSHVTTTRPSAVIMLDDVFGDLEFDRVKWHKWKDALHEVLSLKEHRSHELQTKKSVTVMLIGREYVLKTAYSDMGRLADYFTQDEHVVHMSHTTERGMEEKKAIWKAVSYSSGIVLDESTVDKICRIKVPHGFPHVCRLFITIRKKCSNITAEEFFQTPLEFLKQTVLQFMNDKLKLILFKELIKSEEKVTVRELGKLDSGSETIQTAYDLVGTYLRKEDDYFVFDHPSIYDSVAYNICQLYPLFVIDNCNLSFIHERVRIQQSRDTHHNTPSSESGLVVYIPRSYVGDLAKRFIVEISKLNLLQVFSHKEFRDELFTKEVMSILQPLTELITLADCKSGENFLSLLASNKSPQVLKYVHNHIGRQLTEDEINTVLYGVCRYAASDVLKYLTQICDTLKINVKYGDRKQTPLMLAAETRDSEFVLDILSLNPDVNARDEYDGTALHYVCKNGLMSAVTQMIDRRTDINMENRWGWSPLSYACSSSHTEVVKLLLDRGARVDGRSVVKACINGSVEIVSVLFERGATVNMTSHGYTPLHSACITGNMKVIRYLTDKGASVNVQPDELYTSPLHTACSCHKSQAVQYLLHHGADMESRDNRGSTPLHTAAENGSEECVNVLLKAGADVNVQNTNGYTPLHAAMESESKECVYVLLNVGADVNVQSIYGYTPLHNAAGRGSKECVDVLLKAGADVNVQSTHGYTPLHAAADSESKECVDVLLKAGADVNVQSTNGYTPLHNAAGRGSKECVDVLLKAGVDVNVHSTYGYTPLHAAAESESTECVDVLLKVGADVNVQSTNGYTPLHNVAGRGSKECVDVLLKAGADVNVQSTNGYTPLHNAAGRGSKECVDVLLKAGADVKVQSTNGYTPLHIAAGRGSKECVDLLLKAGADGNIQNIHGHTSLHTAVYYTPYSHASYIHLPDTSACQTLIRHRSDINKQDTGGNTPLYLLCRTDSDTEIYKGWTPQPASSYEDVYRTLVTLFIDRRADVSIHNTRGEPALRGWCQTLVRRK